MRRLIGWKGKLLEEMSTDELMDARKHCDYVLNEEPFKRGTIRSDWMDYFSARLTLEDMIDARAKVNESAAYGYA